MNIARRMKNIDASGIRKVFDLAHRINDPINLSIGQPDFMPPQEVRKRAIEAIETQVHRYTVTQGIEDLRDEVRGYLHQEKGFEPEEILITAGAAGALMLAFLVILDPGEEVVIPDPYFVIYKHLTALAGGVPRFLDTYPDFHIDPRALSGLLTAKTKIVVLNNPCNPTGVLLNEEEVRELAGLLKDKSCVLLADEVYDFFSYDAPHVSFGKYHPSALVIGSYSKSHGVPGWRVGYAAGPAEIIEEMKKLQQYSFVCAPSVLQYALVGALGIDRNPQRDAYRRKRDYICGELEGHYEFVAPGGAFYLFPRAPAATGEQFFERAVARKLLIVPGSVFSERDSHFRISFAASDSELRRGVKVLKELAR
jgi:aspartate aminotransferase/aminotransferase